MSSLIIWLVSILTSYGMESYTLVLFHKYIGDNGYKINDEMMDNYLDNMYYDSNINVNDMIELIPIYNILNKMKNTLEFKKMMSYMFYELKMYGAIEEMTIEEKENYLKNPTYFNLLKIECPKERISDFKTRLNELNNSLNDPKVLVEKYKYGKEDVFVYFKEEDEKKDLVRKKK